MLTKKKLEEESKIESSDEELRKDKKAIDQLKSYKKKFEPRWYLSNAFYEGVHFTFGTKDKDGNWNRVPTPKGKTMREIPKAKKQIDSLRNMLLKVKQRPVTYPDMNVIGIDAQKDPEKAKNEEQQAIRQGKYVEYFMNEKMKLERHLKKLVRYAELYNVGYIQIINDNGKKEFAVYDPFEISVYPTISNIDEYPVCVKHIGKRIDDLKGNEMYDQTIIAEIENTVKSGKYSDSQFKDSMMKERYGNAPDDLVMVDELYKIVKVAKTTPSETEGEPDVETGDEEYKCKIKSYIGTRKVREELTKLSRIPMSMFCWGDEAYATSKMEDMMPLNKAYDVFISKLEQKAKKLDTGRIIIQKGEDAKVLTTNDGEFIRYKRVKPEVMEEASVPNAFMEAISLVEGDLKEQGVSVAAMSTLPAGVQAWRAIETLKESDYASIGIQMDNLNECLTDLTEKLIEMLAYDITEFETVQIPMAQGKTEAFKVIGKRGADALTAGGEALPADVVVIDPNRLTKVEIESSLAWTEQGKKDMAIDLVGKQLIPVEIALDMLKVGNTQEIMEKLQAQSTMNKSMIDMPDFKLLPPELQQAVARYLADGGQITDKGGGVNNNGGGAGQPPVAVAQ